MNRRQSPGIWASNHLANPILRRLLRGPAGHRLSRRLALIRYRGRRTGRMYEMPVQFARNGNRIWILPGSPEHKTWWRNPRGGADVHLVLAGHDTHGHAIVIDRSRQPEFAEGLTAYLRAVPQARRALGLPKHAPPSPARPSCGRSATARCWSVSTLTIEPAVSAKRFFTRGTLCSGLSGTTEPAD